MPGTGAGMHHVSVRKRIHQRHEPFPHPKAFKRFLDRFMYFVAVMGLAMTIPQVWTIWIGKNAAGVSLIAWSTYIFTSIFWLIYGIVHKDKLIIFSFLMWIVLNSLVVVGTYLYG